MNMYFKFDAIVGRPIIKTWGFQPSREGEEPSFWRVVWNQLPTDDIMNAVDDQTRPLQPGVISKSVRQQL